jgi:putative flippase GtrA
LDVRQPWIGHEAPDPNATLGASLRFSRQIAAFVVIGIIGYVIDASITWACARYLGLSPDLARLPGFVSAMIVNFFLNRTITFKASRTPVVHAFVKYCAVASMGLAINYATYAVCVFLGPRVGIPVTPNILPVFVVAGSLSAMVVTSMGFKLLPSVRQTGQRRVHDAFFEGAPDLFCVPLESQSRSRFSMSRAFCDKPASTLSRRARCTGGPMRRSVGMPVDPENLI